MNYYPYSRIFNGKEEDVRIIYDTCCQTGAVLDVKDKHAFDEYVLIEDSNTEIIEVEH
jgi:hypothetical protein